MYVPKSGGSVVPKSDVYKCSDPISQVVTLMWFSLVLRLIFEQDCMMRCNIFATFFRLILSVIQRCYLSPVRQGNERERERAWATSTPRISGERRGGIRRITWCYMDSRPQFELNLNPGH